jgi:hypothetical protein
VGETEHPVILEPRLDRPNRIRTAARVSIVLGAACLVLPLLTLGGVTADPGTSGFPTTMALQAIGGVALLAGGTALRQAAPWGRRLIVAVVWITIVWIALFTLYFIVTMVSGMPAMGAVAIGALAILMSALWILVLRRVLRFMRSQDMLRYTREQHD